MQESLKKALKANKFVVSDYLIQVAIRRNLSLNEFLLLIYFDNQVVKNFELEVISKTLGIELNVVMETFNSLMVKGLINLESIKNMDGKLNEVVNLDSIFDDYVEEIEESSQSEVKDDVFKTFERELGRTMSSMELDIINGWLVSGTSEEMILGALREAVYNGVTNFRYIDKIIYDWEKKGFKTMEDVSNHLKNFRESKSKDKEITKKEQEILDYDWLGA